MEIIFSVLIGYILGGIVVFVIPIISIILLAYFLFRPIKACIKNQAKRIKLKKLLRERLKYLP